MLMEPPVFMSPDSDKTFVLSTDASSIAIGAVLEQYDKKKDLLPVAYYSRKLAGKDNPVADYLSRPTFVGYLEDIEKPVLGFEEIYDYISSGKLSPHSKISGLFDRWTTDFLGPFPTSKSGYS
ncbi:hypothetical protein AYI69_g2686 [Smittium culicis]|uniref:Reverse transcriptase/retrotransposon-derived protein RNase H-like domain-containing protein n=1 Tax=Smittium culicis TaxID=133412 RepID=A0A1R1YLS0_9FUNG|nr:hypothetical protein AYI69_g2686 [Smittium culicis]